MVISMRGFSFRIAAICLLLWTGLDLCAPQNGLAERIVLPPAVQHAVLGASHDGQYPLSSDQDSSGFCCMHIAVSANSRLSI
jgi:hypothetical protein